LKEKIMQSCRTLPSKLNGTKLIFQTVNLRQKRRSKWGSVHYVF